VRSSFGRSTTRTASLALLALLLLGADPAADPEAVLDPVQARYDSVRDIHARFEQKSFIASLGREETSRGRVVVARPGRMRWEYTEPAPSVIVVDGESVRMYDPREKKLQILPLGAGAVSPTALGFLLGEAKLRDTFRVAPSEPGRESPSGEVAFELLPRNDAGFESLLLRFEAQSYRLLESVLLDLFGNRTRVRFEQVVENGGIEEVAFTIAVPKDTEVIDLR
jgi:outer membrane lipoprotein-sorting protein